MTGERLLVVGGAGFIGGHLVEALCAQGHSVRVLDDFSTGSMVNLQAVRGDLTVDQGSILHPETVDSACQGVSCVFHLAAISSVTQSMSEPVLAHEINATGTLNVLRSASQAGARVVFASSAAVYGESIEPSAESAKPMPATFYGAQKLLGENYLCSLAATGQLSGLSLRYFNVYGPRQPLDSAYSGVIGAFFKACLAGQPLTINGDGAQSRDFIYVTDVVEATIRAWRNPGANGIARNVGTGRATSVLQLASIVTRTAGVDLRVDNQPEREGDVAHSCADPALAESELGFRARTSLETGLRATWQALAPE